MQAIPAPNTKAYEHLLYRFAFCAAVLIFCAASIWCLLGPNGNELVFFLSFPCCFFYVFTAFNARMFPWRYSVFGPDRKTPRPTGNPVFALQAFASRIGSVSGPLVTWYFFPGGVALSTGIGDAWIPFTLIRRLKRRGKWIGIIHDCKEVCSPLEFSTTFVAADRAGAIYRFLQDSISVQVAELAPSGAVPMRQESPPGHDWSKSPVLKILSILYRIVRVAGALALAGFTGYLCALKYQRREFVEATFLAVFAVVFVVIAGLTILWGIRGHEWRLRNDATD